MLLSDSIRSYFNHNQKVVLLSLVETAILTRPKKSIKPFVVYGAYVVFCRDHKLECVSEDEFWTILKVIELAGFVKIRAGSIGKIGIEGYSLEELKEAILQDFELHWQT